jgi:hypothetical protein
MSVIVKNIKTYQPANTTSAVGDKEYFKWYFTYGSAHRIYIQAAFNTLTARLTYGDNPTVV